MKYHNLLIALCFLMVQEYKTFGSAYRLLGNVYSMMGNTQLSLKNIARANSLNNYTAPIDNLVDRLSLLSASDIYLMKQADDAERNIYPEWAMKLLYRGIQVTPENKYLVSKAVKLYLKMGAVKQIIPILNRHMRFYKDDSNEIKEVADLLDENGANKEALEYYRYAVKLKPDNTELKSFFALALFKAGMKKKSAEYLDELLLKDKTNIEILFNCAYISLRMGEREKCDKYMAELNRLAPNDAKVLRLSGMLAERDGKLLLAIDRYEKSFKGDPSDVSTIQMLGDQLVTQKLWERSITLYRKALENHPNEPSILEKLGSLLIDCPDTKLRNTDEGMEYAQIALDHKVSSPEIILSAGLSLVDAYVSKGDKRTASVYLRSVIELAQNNNAPKEYLNNLGRKLMELNK